MKTKHLFIYLISAFLLFACTPEVTESPDQVTVQLKWLHQAQFAGFYVAQEKGYYAEENLDVTLLEGGPDVDIIENVLAGNADFGIYSSENLIVQRSQNQPVVAIAVIFRQSPLVFVSLAGSGIKEPQDFIGKTAALAPEAMVQFNAMLDRLDLDPDQVEYIPYAYDHAPLYDGEADITYGYSTGGLIRMLETGREFNVIYPGDYGVYLYADTLFSTDRFISENPDLVLRFLRATLRGWQTAIEDMNEAVEITLKYAKEADPNLQTQMMEASLPLIHTGEDHIGWMQPVVWQDMQDILLDQGILKSPVELNQVFTMEFLEIVYSK